MTKKARKDEERDSQASATTDRALFIVTSMSRELILLPYAKLGARLLVGLLSTSAISLISAESLPAPSSPPSTTSLIRLIVDSRLLLLVDGEDVLVVPRLCCRA